MHFGVLSSRGGKVAGEEVESCVGVNLFKGSNILLEVRSYSVGNGKQSKVSSVEMT